MPVISIATADRQRKLPFVHQLGRTHLFMPTRINRSRNEAYA